MKKNNKILLIMLLTLALTLMLQTTAALIITEPQSIKNTFKPFEYSKNDLLISKVIEHSYGESYNVPENLAFDFEVNFGEEYINHTFKTTQGELSTDEKGIMMVSLKPGETIKVENIVEGTKVKVTEVQNKTGFTVKDVSVTQNGTISENETLEIDYTNVYKPNSAKGENIIFNGTKILEGREWQEGDTFAFTLEYQTSRGEWIPLSTKTIEYDKENQNYNQFTFNDDIQVLEFNKLGIQSFRITEVKGNLENIAYDETINYFNFVTTDDTMDGQIDITEVNGYQNITVNKENDQYVLNVLFNNTYEKVEIKDLELKIDVINKIKNVGDYELGPENFEYILVNTDTNEEIKLKTDVNGKLTYDLTYTENDIGKTFNYIVKVINDGKEYVTYTDKEYNVSIKIDLNDNNELTAKIFVDEKETTQATLEFENIYDKKAPVIAPEDTTIDINIENIINNTGDEKLGKDGFEYVLKEQNSTTPIKVTTGKDGKAKITLTYGEEDIGKKYTYTLVQTCPKVEGLTCDEKEYEVEVSLFNDNKIIVKTKINGQEVENNKVTFKNTYHKMIIEDITIDMLINNIVKNTGKYSLGPENFNIQLLDKQTNKTSIATTDENGKAKFNLTFTEDDIGKTYKYQLSLISGNVYGMTYSKETYDIEIKISLNDEYELVATILVNGEEVTDILAEFINVYYISPEEPALPPTIDTTNNAPYLTMMIISGGGLLLIALFQNTKPDNMAYAVATDITLVLEKRRKYYKKKNKKKTNAVHKCQGTTKKKQTKKKTSNYKKSSKKKTTKK